MYQASSEQHRKIVAAIVRCAIRPPKTLRNLDWPRFLQAYYANADAEDLAAEDVSRVLAVADANIFHKSYGDQTGKLWSPNGRLLATTTQITYFKA